MGEHIGLGLDITSLPSAQGGRVLKRPWPCLCRRIIELQGGWDVMRGLREKYRYSIAMVLCGKRALGWPVERDVPTSIIAGGMTNIKSPPFWLT